MTTVETTALDIVRPAVSVEQAKAAWLEYQNMKAALATPEDKQDMQGHIFLKKSYWRKVVRFYKLNLELLKEWHEDTPRGRVFYATYRALHPCGAFCDGDGADFATTIEEFHNARATAHTRAKNRAVSDLVGGGEVSAEEVGDSPQRGDPVPDKDHNWCPAHNTNWFKRGKMKHFAHPIGETGQWCSMPPAEAQASPAAAGTTPGATPPAQGPSVSDWGAFWQATRKLGIRDEDIPKRLGIKSLKADWLDKGRTLADAIEALSPPQPAQAEAKETGA